MSSIYGNKHNDSLFSGGNLPSELAERRQKAIDEIHNIEDRQIANYGSVKEQKEIYQRYSFVPLTLKEDAITTATDTRNGKSVIRFFVATKGDASLFDFTPSTFDTTNLSGELVDDAVVFTYNTDIGLPKVKAQFARDIDLLKKWIEWSTRDVLRFNEQVQADLSGIITQRRERIEDNRKLQAEIGYPTRKE
jgi:hypothetical protein